MKSFSLCNGLRNASQDVWDKVKDEYLKIQDSQDMIKNRTLLSALGCSSKKEIVSRFLNLTLDPSMPLGKNADAKKVMEIVINYSDVGVDEVLDFVNQRFLTLLIK